MSRMKQHLAARLILKVFTLLGTIYPAAITSSPLFIHFDFVCVWVCVCAEALQIHQYLKLCIKMCIKMQIGVRDNFLLR